jgi:inorganic triphosphatase YgiF
MTTPLSHQTKDRDAASSTTGTVEFELKLVTDVAGLRRLPHLSCLAGSTLSRAQRLQTIYYDTAQGHLLQNGMSLRLRKLPRGRSYMTFKGPAPNSDSFFTRTEIEVPAGPNGFDITAFDSDIQNLILKSSHHLELIERYATDFRRKTIDIKTERCAIEVAADSGHFIAGGKDYPLYEIEIELKSGEPSEAIELAKKIAIEGRFQLETISKADRCALLAGLSLPQIEKPRDELSKDSTLDSAIAQILSEALHHYLDYVHPFRENQSPLAIHQMRVGLRRLRAALKSCARLFPETSFRAFADRAGLIASGLGDARDCDAFEQLSFGEALAHHNRPDDAEILKRALTGLRSDAYERASLLIESEINLTFILDMQGFILQRAWRSEANDASFTTLSAPAIYSARDILNNLLLRAIKRGKDIINKSDEDRHEFRIALKNLRYNAGLFGSLFGSTKSRKGWMTDLANLQEILGHHNDLANVQIMLERIKPFAEGNFTQSAGFITGWHACNSQRADQKLQKTWKRLKDQKPFWK